MTLFHVRTVIMLAAIAGALLLYVRMPKPRTRVFRLAGLLTAVAFALELIGYASGLARQTNVPLYNTFVVVEFVLVLLMARAQQPRWSKAMAVVAVLGIAGFAFNALFVDPWKEMLFEGTVWISFLLACVISALLWRMANTIGQDLRTVPAFWLFTAMGVYFIALPPVIGLARSLRADLHLASTIWTIMPVLCTIRYLLAAYAFWIEGNRSRTPHE